MTAGALAECAKGHKRNDRGMIGWGAGGGPARGEMCYCTKVYSPAVPKLGILSAVAYGIVIVPMTAPLRDAV